MASSELARGRETVRRHGRRLVVGAAAGTSVLALVVGCGKSNHDIRTSFAGNPIERIDFDYAGGSIVDANAGPQYGDLCLENSPYDPILEHDFTNDGVRQPQATQLPAQVSFIHGKGGEQIAVIKPQGVYEGAQPLELTGFNNLNQPLQPLNSASKNILVGYNC